MILPSISVVIPAKNREATLAECLESVLGQSLSPCEIIVVDDASDDGTAALATSYSGQGVSVIRLAQTGGAQAARNAGIRAASGDWIAFQDSDDTWLTEKLALQVQALAKRSFDPCTVVYSDYLRRDMTARSVVRVRVPHLTGESYAALLVSQGPLFPSLLASRANLLQIGLLDEQCPSYQEWDTAIRLARTGFFVHLPEPLFEWRWHGGETISKDMARRFVGFRYVIEKHRDEIVRLHGEAAWNSLEAGNLATALRDGLYDEILATVDNETGGAAHRLVGFLAHRRICPPGIRRLLRLATKTWTGKHR